VTIFPGLFEPFLRLGVLGGAVEAGHLEVGVHDLRDYTRDRHRSVDDEPYGGGPGMVMKPEPLVAALEDLAGPKGSRSDKWVVLLTPRGRPFDRAGAGEMARRLLAGQGLVLVCGRYEGVDERVVTLAVDAELSLGDFVLSGGEVAAMAVIEAVSRFVPGVLGNPASLETESFEGELLEAPQYTRPAEFRGETVPEVLRSGNHAAIEAWRAEQAQALTERRRPDLLPASSESPKGRKEKPR
jgi:tRNA (guanine37-N1)-methyltransferase